MVHVHHTLDTIFLIDLPGISDADPTEADQFSRLQRRVCSTDDLLLLHALPLNYTASRPKQLLQDGCPGTPSLLLFSIVNWQHYNFPITIQISKGSKTLSKNSARQSNTATCTFTQSLHTSHPEDGA
eukprot:scpid56162/ scgid33593/ 